MYIYVRTNQVWILYPVQLGQVYKTVQKLTKEGHQVLVTSKQMGA